MGDTECQPVYGRPRVKKLDDSPENLARLAELGEVMFTVTEVAAAMETSPAQVRDALRRQKASNAYQGGRMRALESLRRAQFKHAQTNASMAMFLGRTLLGQSEQREGEHGEAAFDLSGASKRVEAKLAAIAALAEAEGDRERDQGAS